MKRLLNLIATGAATIVLGIGCVTTLRAADEPKPAPKPEAYPQQETEAINKTIEELRKRQTETPPKLEINGNSFGFVIINGANHNAVTKTLEEGGVKYQTPRQAAYEADRHTAEKIKRLVHEADARARLLLEGGAPSAVLR